MLLLHADIDFEDRVFSWAEWKGEKQKMPVNDAGEQQVPVLKLIDGTMMPESAKIAEYIARQSGAPLWPDEEAKQTAAINMW
jgi:glutathione S-transferase